MKGPCNYRFASSVRRVLPAQGYCLLSRSFVPYFIEGSSILESSNALNCFKSHIFVRVTIGVFKLDIDMTMLFLKMPTTFVTKVTGWFLLLQLYAPFPTRLFHTSSPRPIGDGHRTCTTFKGNCRGLRENFKATQPHEPFKSKHLVCVRYEIVLYSLWQDCTSKKSV